ncbi:hypothetical protein D9758_013866 [Tetrapyrgos nigripes]|uniref:HMG box domain-containing protein n=1 Tax=Tetrapyrgos nigripes TaxID=182062 RepID=A0A8H5CS16_9AGAR|nr:hypothetical protein D9758_013866 [Tetrapyrgos nigripes]
MPPQRRSNSQKRSNVFGWTPPNVVEEELQPSDHESSSSSDASEQVDSPSSPSASTSPDPSEGERVRRPRNPFIIFRCDFVEELKQKQNAARSERQGDISKDAGEAWARLPEETRIRYRHLAALEKVRHHELYPDYVFKPVSSKNKKQEPQKQKQKSGRPRKTRSASEKISNEQHTSSLLSPVIMDMVSLIFFSSIPTSY